MDTAVADEVLRLLSPLGVEAALVAVERCEEDNAETRRQVELALTQARYEADLARRQYDAVDPTNRLVASELERRWNERLEEVRRQEERVAAIEAASPERLSAGEQGRLMALGEDLAAAWAHPGATVETRKRILRTVLEEIVVTLADDRIDLLLHWRGGDHTRLGVPRNRTGQHRWRTAEEVGDLIRSLATATVRRRDCRDAEPSGQENRSRQHLDASAGLQLSRRPRCRGPSSPARWPSAAN